MHTPGPWKCGKEEPFVYALNDAGTNRFFCAVQSGWITEGGAHRARDERAPIDEMQANARLIAAAPDLLAALKTLSDEVFGKGYDSEPNVYADYDHLCELAGIARAAISKAESTN